MTEKRLTLGDLAMAAHIWAVEVLLENFKKLAPFYVTEDKIAKVLVEKWRFITGVTVCVFAAKRCQKDGMSDWSKIIKIFCESWMKTDDEVGKCLKTTEIFIQESWSKDDLISKVIEMLDFTFNGIVKKKYIDESLPQRGIRL